MAQKYILVCEQTNPTIESSEKSTQVMEFGAKDRLQTYRNGIVRGLTMAGFKFNTGFMDSALLVKDAVRYQIFLMTEQEWKDW